MPLVFLLVPPAVLGLTAVGTHPWYVPEPVIVRWLVACAATLLILVATVAQDHRRRARGDRRDHALSRRPAGCIALDGLGETDAVSERLLSHRHVGPHRRADR